MCDVWKQWFSIFLLLTSKNMLDWMPAKPVEHYWDCTNVQLTHIVVHRCFRLPSSTLFFLPCGVLDSIAHITRHLYTFTLRFVLMLMTQEFLDLGYISLICITTSLTVAFRRVPVPSQWFPLQKPVIFLCSASSRPKNHIYLVFCIYLVFLLGPSCLHAVIFPYSLNPFMIKMCNPLTCNATLGGKKLF